MLTGNTQHDLEVIDGALNRGVDFLSRRQMPSGEFPVLVGTGPTLEIDAQPDSSPFATAMIASSIRFIDSTKARSLIARACDFFLKEMEENGVWRFWTKQHQFHSVIPPDLDDIAYVSSVLKQQGVGFPDNIRLILQSRNPAGLFYTWICPRRRIPLDGKYLKIVLRQLLHPVTFYYFWKINECGRYDIDCVVNANVLAFLGNRIESRSVIDYLVNMFRAESEACCDKWHLNRFTFYYAVSRAYASGVEDLAVLRDEMIDRIESPISDDLIGENELDTALAVNALLNWNCDTEKFRDQVSALLSRQLPEGGWRKLTLFYGGPKKLRSWGSEELSTGFCLEALARYRLKVLDNSRIDTITAER